LAFFLIAVIVIAVGITLTRGTESLRRIFSGAPYIFDSNRQIMLPDGTTIPASVLCAGAVNFKMPLIATYEDNSQEKIFEKASAPGLTVLTRGKPVSDISALVVAAFALSTLLPSTARALFKVNFTSLIANTKYGCNLVPKQVEDQDRINWHPDFDVDCGITDIP